MTFFEWLWLLMALFGVVIYLRGRFGDIGDFHGSGMARYAGTVLGLSVAGFGGLLFLIARLI